MSNVFVSPRLLVAVVAVVLMFVAVRDVSAGAETFEVNSALTTNDGFCTPEDGGCTLPEAIFAANGHSGPDTITFKDTITTISVDAPLTTISGTDGVTIGGSGATVTLQPTAASTATRGLVVRSETGFALQNVTVHNMAFLGFASDGLLICGGTVANNCDAGISNVTLDSIQSFSNGANGIAVWGTGIRLVTTTNTDTENNTLDGLSVLGSLTSVEDTKITSATSISDRVGVAVAAPDNVQDIEIASSNISLGTSGIVFAGPYSDHVNLHGNTISDESVVGIGFDNTSETEFTMLTNNIIQRTTSDGIVIVTALAATIEAEDNHISDAGGRGFSIDSSGDVLFTALSGNTIERTGGEGVYIVATDEAQSSVISGNTLTSAGKTGIFVSGVQYSVNQISGNTVSFSTFDGIHVQAGAPKPAFTTPNTVSGNTVFGNGGDGIEIAPNGLVFPVVTVSQNSTRDNTEIGIDLYAQTDSTPGVTPNDAGDTDNGVNSLLNYPEVGGDTPLGVTGLACASCTIELFVADGDASTHGEGKTYLASAQADGVGAFTVPICGQDAGTAVTLTATDSAGETSEFSVNHTLTSTSAACPTPTPSPSPTPSPTPTESPTPSPSPTAGPRKGDLDCNNVVNARDGLIGFLFAAGLPLLSRTGNCPALDSTVGGHEFGDMDCDGDEDASDGIDIVAAYASVPRDLGAGCAPVGS